MAKRQDIANLLINLWLFIEARKQCELHPQQYDNEIVCMYITILIPVPLVP